MRFECERIVHQTEMPSRSCYQSFDDEHLFYRKQDLVRQAASTLVHFAMILSGVVPTDRRYFQEIVHLRAFVLMAMFLLQFSQPCWHSRDSFLVSQELRSEQF